MTTDVDTALEVVAAAVVGMALLIALLVVAEQVLLRPSVARAGHEPPTADAPVRTTPDAGPEATSSCAASGSVGQ